MDGNGQKPKPTPGGIASIHMSQAGLWGVLTGTEAKIYGVLISHADAFTGIVRFLAVGTIAREAAMSERTVQRALSSMAAKGVIHISPGGGRRTPNTYRIEYNPAAAGLKRPEKPRQGCDGVSAFNGAKSGKPRQSCDTLSEKPRQTEPERVTTGDKNPVKAVTPIHLGNTKNTTTSDKSNYTTPDKNPGGPGGGGGLKPQQEPEKKTPEPTEIETALQAAGIKDPGVLAELAAIPEITPAVVELAAREARDRPGVVVKILRDPDHVTKLTEGVQALKAAREAPAKDTARRHAENAKHAQTLENEDVERQWAKGYFADMTASQQAAILQQAWSKTPNFARRLLLWKIPPDPFENRTFRIYAMQAMREHGGFTMGEAEESQTDPFPRLLVGDRTPEGVPIPQNRLEAKYERSTAKVG